MRLHYMLAIAFLLLVARAWNGTTHREGWGTAATAVSVSQDAGAWFRATKPFCNALEVDLRLQQAPPPAGSDGVALAGACLAIAGRIDDARQQFEQLPGAARAQAVMTLFAIGHPIADQGDDRSAGPIMDLVLEFWPQNYMARYHAGMSRYALGDRSAARRHLETFLSLYQENDGWTRNARLVMQRLSAP